MKKFIAAIVLAMVIAGCFFMCGCADSKVDSSIDEQYAGIYNMFDEDGADLGITVVIRKDGTTTSYMHGNYNFINKDKKLQLVMTFKANKDDPAVYDINKTDHGYVLETAGGAESSKNVELEFVSGTDGISRGREFGGVYSLKDQDETSYVFEDDKTVDLKTRDVWSADGEKFVWGKTKYKLSLEKDNDNIKSMTIEAEDGTGSYIMKAEQD